MSKTGRYKYNSETGIVEKISGCVPGVPTQVYYPAKGNYSKGVHHEHLAKTFYSKQEKRAYLKEKNYAEAG